MEYNFFKIRNRWIIPLKGRLLLITHSIAILCALLFFVLLALLVGVNLSSHQQALLQQTFTLQLTFFMINSILVLFLSNKNLRPRERILQKILTFLLLLPFLLQFPFLPQNNITDLLNNPYYIFPLLSIVSFFELSKGIVIMMGRRSNPSLILSVSFLLLILLGSLLLWLPKSLQHPIPYIDALFTATSAVCVTGLSTIDIATTLTPMGQIILLILIQIGGIGIMTITSFFALFFMGNTSLYNAVALRDMLNGESISSLMKTLVNIIGLTFFVEMIGTLLIWHQVNGTLGTTPLSELWFSLFHAISAFCNAGFSTLEGNLTNKLLANNHAFFLTLSWLIIIGGIGFPVFSNFFYMVGYRIRHILHKKESTKEGRHPIKHLYNLNSKIVAISTLSLLVIGFVGLALLEWHGAFKEMTTMGKITQAFFGSVTPRTAGFNSVAMKSFSSAAILLTIILMWIGGGAQSTAGGIKVNTFTVALLNILSVVRNKQKIMLFNREISSSSIQRSGATILLSIVVIHLAFFSLIILEPSIPPSELLFECVSAMATVGLSLGATPLLGEEGKIILMLLMFLGRVGTITLLASIIRPAENKQYSYPQENIIIT